jgi:hypothetical protein
MKTIKVIFTIAILLSGSVLVSAPAPPAPAAAGGGGGPVCWPPPCVPIDGGISFLIVAGAAYGAKKLKDSRKKTEASS